MYDENFGVNEFFAANYDYEDADSTPLSFEAGGNYDICGDKFV